jgi:hypothetical protein
MRVATAAVALLSLGTFLVRLPTFVVHVQTACPDSHCAYGQLTYTAAAALQRAGFSLSIYAAFQIALVLVWAVVCLSVSVLIAWRKSDDWMALLVVCLLVLWPTSMVIGTFSLGLYSTVKGSPFPDPLLSLLTRFGFFLVFSLFPNGRLVSRWTLLLLWAFLAEEFSYHFLAAWPLQAPSATNRLAAELLWLVTLLSLVPIMWYRYRRLASAVERQQIKLVTFGSCIIIMGFIVRLVPQVLVPTLDQPNSLYNSLSTPILLGVSLILPLSVGLAILRYRLWDVDVLINKALVYGGLSGTLAVVYAGLIIGLESLLGRFIEQNAQPLLIVLSTIVIAALFQPLRGRIQSLIDHRFYRKKYDMAKTLAAFSATLRNEVDLEQLSSQLLALVNETMQPEHTSLWLRSPERRAGRPPRDAEELPLH